MRKLILAILISVCVVSVAIASVNFSPDNDAIDLSNITDVQSDFTIYAVVEPIGASGQEGIFGSSSGNNGIRFSYVGSGGTNDVKLTFGGKADVTSSTLNLASGIAYHVMVRYDDSANELVFERLELDDFNLSNIVSETESYSNTTNSNDGTGFIGTNNFSEDTDGNVGKVVWWDRELTDNERDQVFLSGVETIGMNTWPPPIHCWFLDEVSEGDSIHGYNFADRCGGPDSDGTGNDGDGDSVGLGETVFSFP